LYERITTFGKLRWAGNMARRGITKDAYRILVGKADHSPPSSAEVKE
jgi:hypothetical protein